ncbi:hypothetical protein [Sutcliffiella horikoshii]|uniref:hypothetical protein n=1 Tax=Sutcliffiella horikoshii TaxID=79883 RepID=UPI00384AB849
MGDLKKLSIILSGAMLVLVGGFGLFKWFQNGIVDLNAIFAGALALGFLFNSLTWGDMQGEKATDELDMHIKTQSAKIGYFVLMILALLILFISEGVVNFNEIKNIPLAVVVCLSLAVLPVTEFFYSKRFR